MNTNYVGPQQRARYLGQIGQAYVGPGDVLVPVIVVGVRGHHKRLKLTVQRQDTSQAEITLNLYIEPFMGSLD